jgi:hypothetical protein
MTLILPLTPEQEARLKADADRSGMPLPEYVVRRLLGDEMTDDAAQAQEPAGNLTWGQQVLADLEADEAYPIWTDRPEDSPELARKFAEMASRPGPHPCE